MLVIHADDYGYSAAYDAGIVRAAGAGAIDGASIMVMRSPDPSPLLGTAIELGLHLEAGPSPDEQAAAFERLVGRSPDYVDGHHHVHAGEAIAEAVAKLALRLAVPVRSVDSRHRTFLRRRGVATPDLLIGRLEESEPALPPEIESWLAGAAPSAGVTEWFVHPGYADPSAGSAYDAARSEDLALLLELGDRSRWAERGIRRGSLSRELRS